MFSEVWMEEKGIHHHGEINQGKHGGDEVFACHALAGLTSF